MANEGNLGVTIRETLRRYIGDELVEEDGAVGDDENLLADGMVDSMGMLRLVAFIDDTWDIKVPPEEFVLEPFRTIVDLEDYLTGKLGAKGNADHGG